MNALRRADGHSGRQRSNSFHESHYPLLNLAVGVSSGGDPSAKLFLRRSRSIVWQVAVRLGPETVIAPAAPPRRRVKRNKEES